jgi:hypothetical protein
MDGEVWGGEFGKENKEPSECQKGSLEETVRLPFLPPTFDVLIKLKGVRRNFLLRSDVLTNGRGYE